MRVGTQSSTLVRPERTPEHRHPAARSEGMSLKLPVLFVSDRLALGRARGTGVTGAIAQAVPAVLTLVALLLA